MKAILMCNINT